MADHIFVQRFQNFLQLFLYPLDRFYGHGTLAQGSAPELFSHAGDGVLFLVQKILYLQHELEVFSCVHPLAGLVLPRPEKGELGLPVSQHMGLDLCDGADLTYLVEEPVSAYLLSR